VSGLRDSRLLQWSVFSVMGVLSGLSGRDRYTVEYRLRRFATHCLGLKINLLQSCWHPEKQKAIREAIVRVKGIPGDIVECGVFRGGGTLLMAQTLKELGLNKQIHAFDSFEGMPEATVADQMPDGKVEYTRGVLSQTSLEFVQNRLREAGVSDLVVLYKGYFENTLPNAIKPEVRFALVIIDCDQYAGTRFCLQTLYEFVSPGGLVILDDYYLDGETFDTPGVKKAVDEFLTGKPEQYQLQHMAHSMYGFTKI